MADSVIPDSDLYLFLTADEIREKRRALQTEVDKRQLYITPGTAFGVPGYKGRELQIYQILRPRSENKLKMKLLEIWVPVEQFEEKDKSVTIKKAANTKLETKVRALTEDKAAFFKDELKTEDDVKAAIERRDDPSRRRLRR